jgi:anti-anti-sigma factor
MTIGSGPSDAGPAPRISTAEPAGAAMQVFLRGEIDASCVEELRELFRHAVDGHRSAVVDVRDATFMDGAVLIVLVTANARFPGGLWIRGAAGLVRRLFVVAGLDHLLIS